MKKRRGIVLFVTLMMMLLLLGVVTIFLNKTRQSKDDVTYIYSTIQTNLVTKSLLAYLKEINFDEDMIYFASLVPIPLNLNQSTIIFKIHSAQREININSFVRSSMKDNLISDRFILLLLKYKVKEPDLFLDILKDSVDVDKDDRNSEDSEIVNQYPTFRNSKIYNRIHLEKIIDYYFEKTGDNMIYSVPFSTIFGFSNSTLDINFLSLENMKILFEDANYNVLRAIDEHPEVYEKLEDLPFDDYYMKKIKKGMLGQSISTKTTLLEIEADLNYKTQFKSKISFKYDIKSKKISDYSIDEILLQD